MNQSRSLTVHFLGCQLQPQRSHRARARRLLAHGLLGRLGSSPLTVWLKYLGQAFAHGGSSSRNARRSFRHDAAPFAPLDRPGRSAHARAHARDRRHTAALSAAVDGATSSGCSTGCAGAPSRRSSQRASEGSSSNGTADTPRSSPTCRSRSSRRCAIHCRPGSTSRSSARSTTDEPIAEISRRHGDCPTCASTSRETRSTLDARASAVCQSICTLTGFLSDGAYGSLLHDADAVMTLTTRDHTMLRGAWEAVYQGTPVIVSDWPMLRDAFDEGAVHVDNTPEGIVQGILEIQRIRPGIAKAPQRADAPEGTALAGDPRRHHRESAGCAGKLAAARMSRAFCCQLRRRSTSSRALLPSVRRAGARRRPAR